MKKIRFILILGCMFVCLMGCTNSSPKDKNDVLVVGVEGTYAPFNWLLTEEEDGACKLKDGRYVAGYDVLIADRISKELNVTIEYKIIDWEGLLPALQSGEIDVIMSGITPLEERKKSIDFTDNYYQSDLVVVLLKQSSYANAKSIHDFSGARVTGQINTFPYYVISQMDGVKKENAYEDFPTMIEGLNSGKIDAYVCERTSAMAAAKNNPQITYISLEESFTYDPVQASSSLGLRKGDPRVEKINQVLSTISEDEREKYMNECIEQSYIFME